MLSSDGPTPLPTLRQNLKLLPASPDEDGEPRWQLFDALSNKFYFLSRTALYLFREWRNAVDDESLLACVAKRGIDVSREELEYFIRFLKQNNLLEASDVHTVSDFETQAKARKKHLLLWLLHNYLFIKVPLVRPDLLLTKLYRRFHSLLNFPIYWLAMCFGCLGLFMALRQWETFTHTLQTFLSLPSMVYYIGALILVKAAHELGHAFVAKRYNCRVSSMGVAFLLMTPILYTDTTDAWRLRSKFQRLDIVTAGVRVEIYIACFATFLWSVAPSGSFRDVLFFIATTSWVSSLLINISPFMRFDGYYALSDFLGMENLQPRAFLVGKWFLRERIFGLRLPPPEPLNRQKCILMVTYAWCTWVYRLFLFLGIALLVYFFTFKLLGILLFAVEIVWFVLLPIIKELGVWVNLKSKMSWNQRSAVSALLIIFAVGLVVVPWQKHLTVPAVVDFEQKRDFYPNLEGRIAVWNVAPNKSVKAGDVLGILESSELEQNIVMSESRIQSLSLKWQRSRSDALLRSESMALQAQLSREQSRLASLLEQREQLVLRSPINGLIGNWDEFQKGDYVASNVAVIKVFNPESAVLKAYVSGEELGKLKVGAKGRYIAQQGEVFDNLVTLEAIRPTAVDQLNFRSLSSTYGGPIAATTHKEQEVPDDATYELLLRFDLPQYAPQQLLGTVRLASESSSMFMGAMRHLYGILIRESGF